MQHETPKSSGFYFPAEWHTQEAVWLSFPHNQNTWEGQKLSNIYPSYFQFIAEIAEVEKVRINCTESVKIYLENELKNQKINLKNVELYLHPTNDAWCRDHGPAFLLHQQKKEKIVINWEYNAWGGKYPPFDADNQIPIQIAKTLNLPIVNAGIVMEGGSVDFNGEGTVLTTTNCLLNKNRNPHLSQTEIEKYLCEFYGVNQVIWLGEGIVGDDTDGHIDDITRFINQNTVITMVEKNKKDENYHYLEENLERLQNIQLHNGNKLQIIPIQMPTPYFMDNERLPASYANFLIINEKVIVPTFKCEEDKNALGILQDCFPKHKIIGIDASDIIWGLGSFHCLSQQEPAII
ncbi:MAG: agmatine deiminase family protein [Bacteroidetes bacterium]|nr:MAG: agmatine deiminase family protein [Bacteroidota bacterium]TAG93132.1 MAG: agmatine deiminase family protein [Bacteroidota bacterium]